MNYFSFLHTQIVSGGIRLNAFKIKWNLKAAAKSMQQFCAQLPFNSRQRPFCCLQPPLPFPQQSANCWLDCVFSMSFNICAILFAFHLICNSICPKSEPISNFYFRYFRNFSTLIEAGNTTAKCQQLRCCCSESMYAMRVCVCECNGVYGFGGTWQQPSAFVYYLDVCPVQQATASLPNT